MRKCPTELIQAASEDRLSDQQATKLESHLSGCEACCLKLDQATASPRWWHDASRHLDDSLLADPALDVADSSTPEARLFEADDPIGELKAAGVIDDSNVHPEVLGMLGRYTIEREIGSGGMGVVLKGFDAELNRTVAIKVLAPHLARSAAARQRFIREGRAAASVVHENIVAIHEVDTAGRLPTLVMHFVDGVSLQRHVDTMGPLQVTEALRIAAQTAAGLGAAHRQGIIHRDVKPANILLGGSGGRVWITDFGLARAVDDASLTRTGFIAGTPHYMSPEQARGGKLGAQSDLFGLGSVIYFMLAARPPWRAERSLAVLHRIVQDEHRPLWQINPDVPREVSAMVDRLLSKDANKRYENAESLQKELESMLSQIQNPESPRRLSLAGDMASNKPTRFYAKPWFVAPLAAMLGALVAGHFLTNGSFRSPTPAQTFADPQKDPIQGVVPSAGSPTAEKFAEKEPAHDTTQLALAPRTLFKTAQSPELKNPLVQNSTTTKFPSPSFSPNRSPRSPEPIANGFPRTQVPIGFPIPMIPQVAVPTNKAISSLSVETINQIAEAEILLNEMESILETKTQVPSNQPRKARIESRQDFRQMNTDLSSQRPIENP